LEAAAWIEESKRDGEARQPPGECHRRQPEQPSTRPDPLSRERRASPPLRPFASFPNDSPRAAPTSPGRASFTMVEMRTKLKICGITNLDDAELAAGAGAWAVGLVFHPASPRRCTADMAAVIGATLKRRCEVVGVFVNAPLDEVAATADAAALTIVQLHGEEGPA